LSNDDPAPTPGSTQTLKATVQNASSAAIAAPFTVTLYAGDPHDPQRPLEVIGTQTVNGLGASQSQVLSFSMTLPPGTADHIYSVAVDSGEALVESNENNNSAGYEIEFWSDPAIDAAGDPPVTATLLNNGTSHNVQVDVSVANLSAIALDDVPVN